MRVPSGLLPPVVTAADRDPATRGLAVTGQLGIGSYVGAAVRGRDRRPLGMLCCLSRDPGVHLDGASVRTLEVLADLVGGHLAAGESIGLAARRAHVGRVLERNAVDVHVQPVVDVRPGAVAHEALSWSPGSDRGPATLSADAAAVGRGVQLELLAARATLEVAGRSPQDLLSPEVGEVLLGRARERALTVGTTEHDPIEDHAAVLAALEPLRAAGVRLSVDDAGAGYASLRHVLRLCPDTVEFDIALVSGVDTDPARQAMTAAMVAFAETGATPVAEGVETAD